MSREKKPAGVGVPTIQEVVANPLVHREGEDISSPLILGLDLSTSCVGWALGRAGKVERTGKLVFKDKAGKGESLAVWEDFLALLLTTFTPDILLAEQPQSRAANTTKRHNEMAGIVRKVWYQIQGVEMDDSWFIHPKTIKKALKVPRGRDHDDNKIIMVNKINGLYGLHLKWHKGSKYISDDDIADAIAVLVTYWRLYEGDSR